MTTVDSIEPRRSGAPLTRSERAALSDEKLVEAAIALIAEKGIERVTLRSIGERAGYSRGLVNYRFGTKRELLRKATDRLVKRWAQEAFGTTGASSSGLAGIRHFLEHHRISLRTPECRAYYTLVYAALGPMPEVRAELVQAHKEIRERLARLIRQGVDAGEIRPDAQADLHATWIHGAVRGIAYQWLLDPDDFDLDGAHADLCNGVERSLAQS